MSDTSLSIVVPNYNDAKYLKRCIESVCLQDVLPDELIILDDASTDNSVEIIRGIISSYSFARLVVNEKNLGFGGVPNANKGLKIAKSKYILFLGANDFLLQGCCREIKKAFQSHPKAGLFSALIWQVDENDMFLRLYPSPVLSQYKRYFSPSKCNRFLLKQGSWLTGQTTVYNKKALHEVGGFNVDLGGMCDLFSAQIVVSRYGAIFVPKALAAMRIHKEQLSITTLSNPIYLERIIKYVDENGPKLESDLFTTSMIRRMHLRLYFSSLRVSNGKTDKYITSNIGPIRRLFLGVGNSISIYRKEMSVFFIFLIMRPFDLLPVIYYRFLGINIVRIKERLSGRYPPEQLIKNNVKK